jgi:hypothetical protein
MHAVVASLDKDRERYAQTMKAESSLNVRLSEVKSYIDQRIEVIARIPSHRRGLFVGFRGADPLPVQVLSGVVQGVTENMRDAEESKEQLIGRLNALREELSQSIHVTTKDAVRQQIMQSHDERCSTVGPPCACSSLALRAKVVEEVASKSEAWRNTLLTEKLEAGLASVYERLQLIDSELKSERDQRLLQLSEQNDAMRRECQVHFRCKCKSPTIPMVAHHTHACGP